MRGSPSFFLTIANHWFTRSARAPRLSINSQEGKARQGTWGLYWAGPSVDRRCLAALWWARLSRPRPLDLTRPLPRPGVVYRGWGWGRARARRAPSPRAPRLVLRLLRGVWWFPPAGLLFCRRSPVKKFSKRKFLILKFLFFRGSVFAKPFWKIFLALCPLLKKFFEKIFGIA